MFTGIVEAVGTVLEVAPGRDAVRLRVKAPSLFADLELGESVAVNGVCLTVAQHGAGAARFDVVPETVRRSTLGTLVAGSAVNLERALRPTGRLGGHIVQGHVDGVGSVQSIERGKEGHVITLQSPACVSDYIVGKGSVAIEGVSLTVAWLVAGGFAVTLIPHTLATTTLGRLKPGDGVNLEADIIGKYVARQLARTTGAGSPSESAESDDARLLRLLQEEGFPT